LNNPITTTINYQGREQRVMPQLRVMHAPQPCFFFIYIYIYIYNNPSVSAVCWAICGVVSQSKKKENIK